MLTNSVHYGHQLVSKILPMYPRISPAEVPSELVLLSITANPTMIHKRRPTCWASKSKYVCQREGDKATLYIDSDLQKRNSKCRTAILHQEHVRACLPEDRSNVAVHSINAAAAIVELCVQNAHIP